MRYTIESLYSQGSIDLSADIVSLMGLKDGSQMHVEMVSRKEVLLRKDAQSTLSGGLEKLQSLKGVLLR